MSCGLRRSIRFPFAVEHVDVDEVREGIDRAVRAHPTRTADHPASGAGDQLDPDLVGINGSLTERMADREGANDDLDQVFASWFHGGNLGADRAQELCRRSRLPRADRRCRF